MSKFFVPAQKIELLKKDFKKIEKRAKKLGMEAPVFRVNEDIFEIRKVYQEDYHRQIERNIRFVEVEVSGKLPVYTGWNLVSSIEHSRLKEEEVSYNTVRMNPDYPENVDYRTLPPHCEHCGHNRYRKNTYILFNTDTGKSIQVGSTCIKDFLGEENPDFIIGAATYIDLLGKFVDTYENGSFGSFAKEFPIEEILSVTSAEIRLHGWVSRGDVWNNGGASTSEWVDNVLSKTPDMYSETEKEINDAVNDYDKFIAKGAIEWLNTFDLSDPSLNDYLYNCALCVKKEYLGSKDLGVACSIVSSYKRKLAKDLEKKAPKQISEFVGAEKERLKDLNLIFVNAWTFDSSWGVCTIVRLKDSDGNIFVWKTGYFEEMEVGTVLILTGTVKKHEIYKETKQTIITRCKWDYAEEK